MDILSNGDVIVYNGYVGIGTASPSTLLDVNGDATFGGAVTTPKVAAADATGLKLYDDGGNGIFVKDGGNVGINNQNVKTWESPYTALQIGANGALMSETTSAANTAFALTHNAYYNSGWKYIGAASNEATLIQSYDGTIRLFVAGAGVADADITWTNALTIDNAGDATFGGDVVVNDILWVNETANINMTQGITINQGANDDEILAFKSSDVNHGITTVGETDTYGFMQKASVNTGGVAFIGLSDGGNSQTIVLEGIQGSTVDTGKTTGDYGVIRLAATLKSGTGRTSVGADGNLVTIDNNTTTRFIFDAEGSGHADVEWVAFSDGRLKENQKKSPYGLDEVLALQPKEYDRRSGSFDDKGNVVLEDNARHMVGFVAQDVMKVIPEAVKPIDESKNFYSLNTDPIIAALVKAVQELSAKVDKLEKR